ncbi:MAG TPA: c-type cytochrome domain-containing protein, partial [Verrucomicrobiaceae bacterium]
MKRCAKWFTATLLTVGGAGQLAATEDVAGMAFFESNIRPVLAKNCYECHSVESGKSKGGLRLDSREGVRAGGDTGPAIVPGHPEESLLLRAVKRTDPDLEMPPRKPPLAKS